MTPFVLVIFGATGDLARRKLMPALYDLMRDGKLPDRVFLIGVGRRALTQEAFRDMMRETVDKKMGDRFDENVWKKLSSDVSYVEGKFEERDVYDKLIAQLAAIDDGMKACVPRFFYLATPPVHYETILTYLDNTKLSEGCLPKALLKELKATGAGFGGYTRVFIEKPFGKDLATAQALEKQLSSIFEEQQIYRIDHYLGKETVQNILAFRFANGMFEPTWNREFIDHVQITLAEDIGIGKRGEFYDGVGALRDVVQNHMLQMLALIAMEQPKTFDASAIRVARAKVLRAIERPDLAHVVRGQYKGYREEKDVASGSDTETFVAFKLMVDTHRWKGVPFYIRTGKHLAQKATEIALHFKKPPCSEEACFFNPEHVQANVLSLRIEPDEGIHLRLMVKLPGFGSELGPSDMDFTYRKAFGDARQPGAYERLLLDAIRGDQTLFATTEDTDATWEFTTQILEGWKAKKPPLHTYAPGTWGPAAAEELIAKDGRSWYLAQD